MAKPSLWDNPVTTITYQIPREGLVTLKIYDILGKEVTTLLNEEKQAGKYSIEFKFNASKLSSGVYLYELRSNGYKSTKQLLLMKQRVFTLINFAPYSPQKNTKELPNFYVVKIERIVIYLDVNFKLKIF